MAIWSYHAADCQPTAAVLSVSLVQSAATLYYRKSPEFLLIVLGNS